MFLALCCSNCSFHSFAPFHASSCTLAIPLFLLFLHSVTCTSHSPLPCTVSLASPQTVTMHPLFIELHYSHHSLLFPYSVPHLISSQYTHLLLVLRCSHCSLSLHSYSYSFPPHPSYPQNPPLFCFFYTSAHITLFPSLIAHFSSNLTLYPLLVYWLTFPSLERQRQTCFSLNNFTKACLTLFPHMSAPTRARDLQYTIALFIWMGHASHATHPIHFIRACRLHDLKSMCGKSAYGTGALYFFF